MTTSPASAASGTSGGLDSLLGSLLSTGAGAYGAQNSAEDITQGINAGITTQTNTLGNVNSLYGTQQATGNAADTQLQSALGINGQSMNPNFLANTPGYQFAVQQGTNAVKSAAAANGNAYTPNTLTNVGQTVTGLADQNYNNYVQNLLSTAGIGNSANQGLASANLTTGSNISQLQQNSGIAQGAGVSGVSNGISSLLGSSGVASLLGSAASGIGNLFSGATGGASALGSFLNAGNNGGSSINTALNQSGLTDNLGNNFGNSDNSNYLFNQAGYDPTTGITTNTDNSDLDYLNPSGGNLSFGATDFSS